MNIKRRISRKIRQFLELDRPQFSSPGQKHLMLQYRMIREGQFERLPFREIGFRVYSQHDEDGILLYIFSLIGTKFYTCVELCAGDGIECNCANLIINHRWTGLLCDGNSSNIKKAREFYGQHKDTTYWPPVIGEHWLTRDTINKIIEDHGFSGEIDLLSLDVDGNDLHFWKSLTVIQPRVLVVEFNCLWGESRSVTTPYSDTFQAEFTEYGSDYAGASLPAFVKVSKEKGYRLVGVNSICTNAFFVRNDIVCEHLPETSAGECLQHPRVKFAMERRLPLVKEKKWEEV